ncbi:MAG: DUF4838 domain-containing protein, partial [Clostridia bacterium]|nr:DUF4838 domain-containing protein [Clostridia bacterium]
YIDCDTEGGIIAGDNPRSVLLAVYEYLRQNGCRWLYPGIDGEYIPMQDIVPVKYRHKPSCRYRGQCNEGSESQQCMLETIEFTPKVGMNVYMLEFKIPTSYYVRYYNHIHNDMNRPPEPVTNEQILQWKRQCEAEIAKRGLQFHDIGHGWTADPFGIDSSLRAWDGDNNAKLTDEQRSRLALVGGKRELRGGVPNYTQCCIGDDETRELMVQYVADYAEKHGNVDYLHVWLGDSVNAQCECEKCIKRTPSDWYMIMMNEIDEELTKRKLNTRIVFISYVDTIWAPETEALKNPERFTLLFAPISRKYTETLPKVLRGAKTVPYTRNTLVMPGDLEENLAYYADWRRSFKGAAFAYEYHFWRHQYYDVAGIELSKRINEDIKAYKAHGIDGIVEDGSQRSFFPSGLAFYTYARTLYDTSLSFEDIVEEYMSVAYGEDWRKFYDYLEKLGGAFDYYYLEQERSADAEKSPFYNPAHAESLARVKAITAEGRELIKAHYNSPVRVQTVSVRLLEQHARYAELMAEALIPKAKGEDDLADELFLEAKAEFGKHETAIERYYDHGLAFYSWEPIFKTKMKSKTEPIIALEN